MYAIKVNLVGFIWSKEDCMQKIKDINQNIRKKKAFLRNYVWHRDSDHDEHQVKLLTSVPMEV